MVQVTINVDIGKISDLENKVPEITSKGLLYASEEMVRQLMINSPVQHGLLKSWYIDSLDEEESHIKTPAEYAEWVNDGHPQQPGRYIPGEWNGDRFEYDPDSPTGMVLKADYVEGKHFVEDSMDEVGGKLDSYFLKALSEVLG